MREVEGTQIESDQDMGLTRQWLWRGGEEMHLGLWILDWSEVVSTGLSGPAADSDNCRLIECMP